MTLFSTNYLFKTALILSVASFTEAEFGIITYNSWLPIEYVDEYVSDFN